MALTVLALAADFIRKQVLGSAPVTTRYTTFTGGFGMIVCGITAASVYLSFLPGLVALGLDALAGLFFLGGGIVRLPCSLSSRTRESNHAPSSPLQAWAYGLRDVNGCTNGDNMLINNLLNRGSVQVGDSTAYGIVEPGDENDPMALYSRLRGNCQRAQAAEILQFLCFGVAAFLAGAGFYMMRKGVTNGPGRGAYVA
ncbi:hypothetical protein VTJ49DRAFT_6004 [Mycothermus thermophilus]|uniref:MARVEL domain-containing protein n=1 Tax=Humicola insolens TaxID=85995 RepID=A0ABR3VL56_HUMIN